MAQTSTGQARASTRMDELGGHRHVPRKRVAVDARDPIASAGEQPAECTAGASRSSDTWTSELQRAAVAPVRLQSTRASLPDGGLMLAAGERDAVDACGVEVPALCGEHLTDAQPFSQSAHRPHARLGRDALARPRGTGRFEAIGTTGPAVERLPGSTAGMSVGAQMAQARSPLIVAARTGVALVLRVHLVRGSPCRGHRRQGRKGSLGLLLRPGLTGGTGGLGRGDLDTPWSLANASWPAWWPGGRRGLVRLGAVAIPTSGAPSATGSPSAGVRRKAGRAPSRLPPPRSAQWSYATLLLRRGNCPQPRGTQPP